MKSPPLSKNQIALVDDSDFEVLSRYAWYAVSCNGRYYARRTEWSGDPKKHHFIYLHRQILDLQSGEEADHVNRNTLDCQRSNLRRANRKEQARNRRYPNTRGIYKGVWPVKSLKNPWSAMIGPGGDRRYLGVFPTAEAAGRAYDAAAKELYGEFAALNFPEAKG